MVEVVHPGWFSIIVDNGRFGYAHIGVPWSSALDGFAYATLNVLLGNNPAAPAIEVLGNDFSLRFHDNVSFAITGAFVNGLLDGEPVGSWKTFRAHQGATLRGVKVMEGFRYYVGVSGMIDLPEVIGSFSTNLECRFGGYNGRPLMKGDTLAFKDARVMDAREVRIEQITYLGPPHVLRWIEGPEAGYFREASIKKLFDGDTDPSYTVSGKSNRIGIRLEGEPLRFKKSAQKSIISEAHTPGTIQVPGDGLPIIALYERMHGGYARLGVIARADADRLAHLKPKDKIHFQRITREEALELGRRRDEAIAALCRKLA